MRLYGLTRALLCAMVQDSKLVLAVNPANQSSQSNQAKQSKGHYQRHVELRQLADGVFLGEDFLYLRVKSSSWKPLGITLTVTRVMQQLFSDRDLAPDAITIRQKETVSRASVSGQYYEGEPLFNTTVCEQQNVSRNVVCPQFHGVSYHTVLEEVDVVIDVSGAAAHQKSFSCG